MKNNLSVKVYKVTNLQMHGALTWTGVVAGDKTVNDKKIKGLEMSWNPLEQGVRMSVKDKECFVPSGSINYFEFVE